MEAVPGSYPIVSPNLNCGNFCDCVSFPWSYVYPWALALEVEGLLRRVQQEC